MPDNEDGDLHVPATRATAMPVEYDDDENHKYNELRMEEKLLLDNVLIHGVNYLLVTKGWTLTATREFMSKAECQRYMKYNLELYDNRKGVQERTQFYAQLRINSMVPSALAVLTKALVGHQFDADGNLKSRAPDRGQFDAAMEVLSRANIQGVKFAGDSSKAPTIDARSVTVNVNRETEKLENLTPAKRSRLSKILKGLTQFVNEGGDAADRVMAGRRDAPDDDGDDDRDEPAAREVEAEVRPARHRPRSPRPE